MKSLQEELSVFGALAAELEKKCRAFCADETKSVAERWEVFKQAPNKVYDPVYDLPPHDLLGFEVVAYDDLGLDRNAVFDVVRQLDYFQKQLTGTYKCDFVKQLDQEKIDLLKNYYMVRYIGSWENDW